MRVLRPGAAVLAAIGCLALFAAAPAGAATPPHYPVDYSFTDGVAKAIADPDAAPPGANDWSCVPSGTHPYPVVLVHGTFADMADDWNALSPLLADSGYCVYAFNFGGAPGGLIQGYEEIGASAGELSAFVGRVLAATGASRVDLVGHSQGGMMPRYYLKYLGGAAKVHELVGLAPSNHGTTLDGLTALLTFFPAAAPILAAFCDACAEQVAGSQFITGLNAGGDTLPGVGYTVIETRYDEVVTPYTSAFLTGPGVTNILVQNQCPFDTSEHAAFAYDPVALHDVLNALDPATATAPAC